MSDSARDLSTTTEGDPVPRPARRRLLILTCVLFAVAAPAAAAARLDRVERQVVRSLNGVRGTYGLARLRVGRGITNVATAHSRTMAHTGVFSHGHWLSRVAQTARTARVGEVLAYVIRISPRRQAGTVVRDWLNSPSHRVVILSPSFHRVGVGRARGHRVTFFTVDVAR